MLCEPKYQNGLGYEYGINDLHGLGLRIGNMGEPNLNIMSDHLNEFNNMQLFTATLDYRYFSIPDEGADRVFYGLYVRLRQMQGELNYTDFNAFFSSNGQQQAELDEMNVGLGLTYGEKWVYRNGFFFEYFGGAGYFFNTNELLALDQAGTFQYSPLDIRLGVIIGNRFH